MKQIIILLLLLFSLESIAQSVYERQLKYWYLRDRLRHFTVPSNDPLNERGTFLVIGSRNTNWPENHKWTTRAGFGQQMEYYGYYIGVLATEYYLLLESGETEQAATVNNELLLALKAYERRDLCEELLEPPLPNTYDGFFIRSDVPEDDLLNENPPQNSFLLNSDLNNKNPVLINSDPLLDSTELLRVVNYTSNQDPSHIQYEKMSQDEAVFLLEGLALTYKFGSFEAREIARIYAHIVLHRLYGYVSSGIHNSNWIIHDAYGIPIPGAEGGNCKALSFGYSKMAKDFFGFNEFIHSPGSLVIWDAAFHGPISGYNAHMIAGIAAISNGWGSFLHKTQHGIYNNTDQDGWDYYYLWLYKALWDRDWSLYDVDRIEDRLDEAPCEGPYCESFDILAPNGWASTDKWRESKDLQDGQRIGNVGIYAGLDYMILLNLYFINSIEDKSLYKNYAQMHTDQVWPNNGIGSVDNPYLLEVFRSIFSTDNLKSDPAADITYKAGVNITLLPGFKVEKGAHFITSISHMDYCSTPPPIRNKQLSYPPISIDSNVFKNISANNWTENVIKNWDDSFVNSIKNNLKGITVYPNPSTGIFTIQNSKIIDRFEIYSFNGHLVKKGEIEDSSFTIDLSSFSNGIFTLILFSEGQTCAKKLSMIK